MKLLKLCILTVTATGLYVGQFAAGSQPTTKEPDSGVNKSFVVFDATLYRNKPDMRPYGIESIKVFYEWELWGKWRNRDKQRLPKKDNIQSLAFEAKNLGIFSVINIEHWPLLGEDHFVQENIDKYKTVLAWFREAWPGTKFGYYGAPPIVDYWRAVKSRNSVEHRSWQKDNDRIAPLAQDVDVLFPSAYTFYADQSGWQKHAIAQINAARAYDYRKPVFVFLWPQFHESNRLVGGRYLPVDYWKMELNTALKHADGVVIWGGWQQDWDESAPWWKATKALLMEINKGSQRP